MVDGVVYIDTPGGGVAAIDGKTGAVKWKWVPAATPPERGGFNPSGTRRGVSVGDGKVYTLAGGNRVVALNKDTGAHGVGVQPTGPGGERASATSPRSAPSTTTAWSTSAPTTATATPASR